MMKYLHNVLIRNQNVDFLLQKFYRFNLLLNLFSYLFLFLTFKVKGIYFFEYINDLKNLNFICYISH